jgi:SAM-dependent methyltransferase
MPGLPLLEFNLVTCPLPDSSIDAAILLNVLEHISDDAAAMRQIHRILRPGGIAVIEVPAAPHLYDVYDKVLLHCRRYSLVSLIALAENAGLNVVEKSHLGFFVYPGFWFTKTRNKRFLSAEGVVQQRIVAESIQNTRRSRLLDVVTRLELFVGRWVSYPLGIRCLLTCTKPT